MQLDYLSIWEIAHRWHDIDPNFTDPKALPLEIQDRLRHITRAVHFHNGHITNEHGVQYINQSDIRAEHDFVADGDMTETERMDAYEAYEDQMLNRIDRTHNALADGLERCFRDRRYDKDKLDSVYMTRESVRTYCQDNHLPLPTFWFPNTEANRSEQPSPVSAPALRNDQLTRERCRAVAQTLWYLDDKLTITAIAKHHAIREFAGGRYFGGRDTIRNWIKDLDPRPTDEKVGRPKNAEK